LLRLRHYKRISPEKFLVKKGHSPPTIRLVGKNLGRGFFRFDRRLDGHLAHGYTVAAYLQHGKNAGCIIAPSANNLLTFA